MNAPAPYQSWPRLLGEIAFLIAMFLGIATGVPKGVALLIPADFCAGAPIRDSAYFMTIVVWVAIAFPKNKAGFRPILRLGAVMLAGNLLAYFVARIAVGCTPASGWDESAHYAVGIFVVLAVITPLAVLHRRVIEPRWARALGGGGDKTEGDQL